MSAFDRLHELPVGRRAFRVLSIVWGVGLVVEAAFRLTLADVLPTGTFLAVSPFVTAGVVGGLFAFTVLYSGAAVRGRCRRAGAPWRRNRRPTGGPLPRFSSPDTRR